jgi:Fe-S cluster assembly ATP-binding protein
MQLEIRNLQASIGEKPILKGLDLTIKPGELHVIMGPNGSGKSTLGKILAGDPNFVVTGGSVHWGSEDLLGSAPFVRAQKGLFLGFQYPVTLPGVTNATFLKESYRTIAAAQNRTPLDAVQMMKHLRTLAASVGLDDSYLKRPVNEGFSGGEKKRNEILQLLLLEPSLAILDELDSGLDVDALKMVATAIVGTRNATRSFLLITHYERLLTYLIPDVVHVMQAGRLAASGGIELAQRIEEEGYGWLLST